MVLIEIKKRILFLYLLGTGNFIEPIINVAKKYYEVEILVLHNKISQEQILETITRADIIWVEWGNHVAEFVTKLGKDILQDKRIIVRTHSFEVLVGYTPTINWSRVNDAVFVAKHVKNVALTVEPKLSEAHKIHIIPNGVDLKKYEFKQRKPGYNLAFIAHISHKKGLMLLMQAFKALVDKNPKYMLHIAGDFQEDRFLYYMKYMIGCMGLGEHIHYHGWIEDIAQWLEDKQYVVCSSPWESQGMGLQESMARGLKPLVHNFPGSADIYPHECIWITIPEFVTMVTDTTIESKRYRRWIEERYSLEKADRAIEKLLVY